MYNAYQSLLNGLDTLVQVCESFPTPPSNVPFIHYDNSPQKNVCSIIIAFEGLGVITTFLNKMTKTLFRIWWQLMYWLWVILCITKLWFMGILKLLLSGKYLYLSKTHDGIFFGLGQVHSTSKKLLYQLDHLVQVCNQSDLTPVADQHHKHVSFF